MHGVLKSSLLESVSPKELKRLELSPVQAFGCDELMELIKGNKNLLQPAFRSHTASSTRQSATGTVNRPWREEDYTHDPS